MESIDLDLLPGAMPPIVHVSQGDVGRQFSISIYDDTNAAYSLTGNTVSIVGRKEDGCVFQYDIPSTSISGNTVTITTKEQMTAKSGKTLCEIRIERNDTRLGTCNFVIDVERSPTDMGLVSESELDKLDVLLERAQTNVNTSINAAATATQKASEAANSASEAAASRDRAENRAVAAKASLNEATTKASEAATSATASATSASEAATSASEAATSASEAAASQELAANRVVAARAAVNDARQAASEAAASATASATSASEAANSASEAAASRDRAENRSVAAKASSNEATTKASEAAASATVAEDAKAKIEGMTVSAQSVAYTKQAAVTKTVKSGVVNLDFQIPRGQPASGHYRLASGKFSFKRAISDLNMSMMRISSAQGSQGWHMYDEYELKQYINNEGKEFYLALAPSASSGTDQIFINFMYNPEEAAIWLQTGPGWKEVEFIENDTILKDWILDWTYNKLDQPIQFLRNSADEYIQPQHIYVNLLFGYGSSENKLQGLQVIIHTDEPVHAISTKAPLVATGLENYPTYPRIDDLLWSFSGICLVEQ